MIADLLAAMREWHNRIGEGIFTNKFFAVVKVTNKNI